MDKIKDLFEAYGIAIGIIVETTGDFLSSVGQVIIDKFQPPLKYDNRTQPTCSDEKCFKNNKNIIDNTLRDLPFNKDWTPALPKSEPQNEQQRIKRETRLHDLGYDEDPFHLKEITLGGDQPGLASEIAYLKRHNDKN
jgi:hypothetical protein